MELLDLYDDNGNKLNKTVERGKKFTEGNIMLSMAIIKNDNDEYLIQKTSKEKGSIYSLTGGHVVHNETALESVIREVKEELGIDISEDEIEKISIDNHPKAPALVNLFLINKNINADNLKLQKEEVESVSWLSQEEVLDLIENNKFHPTHSYFFKKYYKKVGRK